MPSKGVQRLNIHYRRSVGGDNYTAIHLLTMLKLLCSDLLDWLAFCRFQTFTVQSSEPVTRTGSDGWKATDVTASK